MKRRNYRNGFEGCYISCFRYNPFRPVAALFLAAFASLQFSFWTSPFLSPLLALLYLYNPGFRLLPFLSSLPSTSSPGPSPRSKWRSEKPLANSKSSLEFCHANTVKCLRFVWITVSDCRKQIGPPDAGNNVRKSHFIMCHVTKYSTFVEYFSSLGQGFSDRHFERWEGPGDEVALPSQVLAQKELWLSMQLKLNLASLDVFFSYLWY